MRMDRLALVLVLAGSLSACAAGGTPAAPPPNCPAPPAEADPAEADRAPSPSSGQPAIPLDLPRADEFAPAPPPEPSGTPSYEMIRVIFAVDVDKEGAIFAEGKPVADDRQLIELARQAIAKEPSVRAVIRADMRASWGSVVHVLDLLKQGGMAKLAFAVSPVPRAP